MVEVYDNRRKRFSRLLLRLRSGYRTLSTASFACMLDPEYITPIQFSVYETSLVNSHSTRHWPMREIGHLHHIRFLVLALRFSIRDIWLESPPEVGCAHDGVDNRNHNEYNGDDRKCRE